MTEYRWALIKNIEKQYNSPGTKNPRIRPMIEVLSTFAVTQPHAAYAAFTHGLTSRWTFLARTTPNIGNLLQPLEEAIRLKFLPALTGKAAFSDDIRDLLALPVRLGGIGVTDPTCLSDFHHTSSKNVSAPLVSLILEQSTAYPTNCIESQKKSKCTARNTRRLHEKNRTVQQTTYQYEESTGGLEGERCIKLAISPTHCRAWLKGTSRASTESICMKIMVSTYYYRS